MQFSEIALIVVCFIDPRPRHQKDGTHGNANGTAVERIAGVASQQHGIDAQGCGRTEDGSDVCRISNPVDDDDAAGLLGDFSYATLLGTAHCTKHTSRQRVARECSQQFTRTRVDGEIVPCDFLVSPCSADNLLGVAFDVLFLAEQRHGLIASL